jgi:beta-glucanase (GH16 family)
MSNNALNESFNNGVGAISNAYNVDTSVPGEIKLAGNSAAMEWATGTDAGHGYGTYTITAKVDGNQPGPAIILWPGDNQWPGQEIDMMEITPDGSGRQYGTVHWNGGGDAYNTAIFDGVGGGWHTYQATWEPGRISFSVDGAYKGSITDHVPADHDHGGMNNTIGFLNNNGNTSITVSDVSFSPSGGGGGSSAQASTATALAQQDTSVAVAAAPQDTPAPAPAASAPVDWNALAAEVNAYHDAHGYYPTVNSDWSLT